MLQRLLGLSFPEGADLTTIGLALRGSIPWWVVTLLVAVATLAVAGIYRREVGRLTRGRRFSLAALRAGALALLIGLIARPAVVAEASGVRPRPVVLLIDNSASLKIADRRPTPQDLLRVAIAKGQAKPDANLDGPEWQSGAREELAQTTRLELARSAVMKSRGDLLDKLQDRFSVKSYVFGTKPRRVSGTGLEQAVVGDEQRTALWDSLRIVASPPDSDPPAAVVVITDGLDNASQASLEDTAAELAKADIAVHAYGIGSTDSGSVRLIDAALPETVFLDDTASIPVRYAYRGTGKPEAIVSLSFGGQEVARQEITLAPGEGRTTLTFVPEKRMVGTMGPGFGVNIRLKKDPAANDEIRKSATVSERRVRVLVVDDAPRWEFKFLQPALSRDRRVDATYYVMQGDPRALRGAPFIPAFPSRDKLFGYDLVILGDVPPAALGPDGVATLVDYVRDGGGLAVIAGRKAMPAEYADTPLAEALPVEFLPVRFPSMSEERTNPFSLELTPAGRRSPMTSLGDTPEENEKIWRELPGFHWRYPVTKLRAGATALVTAGRRGGEDAPAPIVAQHYFGKGPVTFFAADESWRWRFNQEDRLYARFWGQVAYQLGLPHLLGQSSRVQLALDRSDALVGRPGYIYARLYDSDYRPFIADSIAGTIEQYDVTGPERFKSVTLSPVPGRAGEYRVLLPHDAPGRFELRVQRPEAGSLPFRVSLPPGHELEPSGLNDGALRQLAKVTGGDFYREEDLARLPGKVRPRVAPFSARQEAVLWGPLPLIAFVGLVSAEWILRKIANMS